MPLIEAWLKAWLYLGFMIGCFEATRPQFDISTDMGHVLVPADAEVNSTIFRLRATDQDADFPLTFDIYATATPVVRVENLPCTLYNKVCQANVILVRRLIPGRLHDFVVRVKDTKGEFNSMQATISVTNCTTPQDKIFPHIPSLVMVPEDAKPGTELDYILVRGNPWSGKPVYIELWQPKEMFKIRQRQTAATTRGVITLIGELDFETQSMFTLTLYATGDVVLRVHAEDGDKGVPREITYGLLPDNNPFVTFFNISESTGEIFLSRPLQELTQITYVGAPVVLKVVAEEIRRSKDEPPAQSTVVEVGFLLGEPGNNPPHFENDNYMAWLNENAEPGSMVTFSDSYSTKVKDDDVGKAGVFALKLENNNGTFEINPTVGERATNFIITVRDNSLINYEMYHSLNFIITAQEVGPATNLSTSVPVIILLRDVNDNIPIFDEKKYEVDLSENTTMGTKVIQVHATDKDSGLYGMILYTGITGTGSEAFTMDPNSGLISVAMGNKLDRERTPQLQLSVEARDEVGRGLRGVVPFIVNLLDVNDNAPIFDKSSYEFTLNADLTNFTMPAFIKATDADAEPPNNVVRYEIIHGNYDNKFYLNEVTGELVLREAVNKTRYIRQNTHLKKERGANVFNRNKRENISQFFKKKFKPTTNFYSGKNSENIFSKISYVRTKRAEENALFTLTARAYDQGVPHLSSQTQIRVLRGAVMGAARIVLFVMPGEHPDPAKTAKTLATITGESVIIQEIRPYNPQPSDPEGGKKSVIVARVEQQGIGTLVDIEKIRKTLLPYGVGVIMDPNDGVKTITGDTKIITNNSVTINQKEVTTYKAENKLLTWLLILLGLLILLAIICLIICCICPGCPFYMEPRKRRIHSTETLIYRADGRPKKHLRRKRTEDMEKKQAWSADPIKRNWQFNRRNTKQYGLASLPGDVAHVDIEPKRNALSLRLQNDSPAPIHKFMRRSDDDRMYVEDVEAQVRNYETDMDSIRRHEIARGSDISRQRQLANHKANVREQHFFREGNAEVLRLVTRGQDEETQRLREREQLQERGQIHRPVTLVIDQQSHLYRDGKEILLQRFIEDQEIRQDLLGSRHDIEGLSMESHQHPKEVSPRRQEILLIPQRLEAETLKYLPSGQRILIDRSDYTEPRRIENEGNLRREIREGGGEAMASDPASKSAENSTDDTRDPRQANVQTYTINEVELVRQNALLTRLLLEKESSRGVPGNLDAGSYLETQSLPGQVAMATQTDRTTATQTDRQIRSRSDNDESDDENRLRKKAKVKKKVQPIKTSWIKSIPEEIPRSPEVRTIRRKTESKRTPVSPDVLQEISDSLDEVANSSSPRDEEDSPQIRQRTIELSSVSKTEDSTSPETEKDKFIKNRIKKAKEKPSSKKKEEPSFRILEKEITSLQKKIRNFGQRKYKKVDMQTEDEDDTERKKGSKNVKDLNSKKDTKKDFRQNYDSKTKDQDSSTKESDVPRKKKLDQGRIKKHTLKHQEVVQSINSEISESENIKAKELNLKKVEISKRPFKIKRQSRLQVSKGTMKNIISRTKEVTKRKVRELKKSDDSSGEKQLIRSSKVTQESKILPKDDLSDISKSAYTIISTRMESPPSKITDKHQKAETKTKPEANKDEGKYSIPQQERISRETEKEKQISNAKFDNKTKKILQHVTDENEQFSDTNKKENISMQQISEKGVQQVSEANFSKGTLFSKATLEENKEDTNETSSPFLELKSATIDQGTCGKLNETNENELSSIKEKLIKDEMNIKEKVIKETKDIKEKLTKDEMDIKEKVIKETKDIKEKLVKETTDIKNELLQKNANKKEQLITEVSEAKDELIKTTMDQKDQLIEKATIQKDQLIEEITDKKNQLIEKANRIDEQMEKATDKKNQLLEDATDKKNQLLKEATDQKNKLLEDATDYKDQFLDKEIETKEKLVDIVTEVMDKLMTTPDKIDNLMDVAAENTDKTNTKVDKTTKESPKIPIKETEEVKIKKSENVTQQKEESSPKMKPLMLETEDMRFIDDSQESTVDTSDETDSTIKQFKNVQEINKTDSDSRTLSFDETRSSESKDKEKTVESKETSDELKGERIIETSQTETSETSSDSSANVSKEKAYKLLRSSTDSFVDHEQFLQSFQDSESKEKNDVKKNAKIEEESLKEDADDKKIHTQDKKTAKDIPLKTVSNQDESTKKIISPTKSSSNLDKNKPITLQQKFDKILEEPSKSVDETKVSKPSMEKIEKETSFDSIAKKDNLTFRNEDHERKMAKILQEEQQRLQRLELLYKQFSGTTESDSDSSTESDMSSKTMLTTQPYHTPRHSPKIFDTDDSKKSENNLQASKNNLEKKNSLKISRQAALDIEDKTDIKKQTDDNGHIKKKNVKEYQKSSKTSVTKPRKEIKNSLSENEIKKSKFRDKSPLIPKFDSKKQVSKLLPEDSGKKQHKSQHERDKSPMVHGIDTLGRDTKKPPVEKSTKINDNSKRTILKKDTKKIFASSTTEIERQKKIAEEHSKKSISQERRQRSLSPKKEEKIREKSPSLHQKEKQLDKNSPKSPQRETKKLIRDKSPLVSDQSEIHHLKKSKIDIKPESEEPIKAESRYMSWYKQKREEMEKKRVERKLVEEEKQRPRWMKTSLLTIPKEPNKSPEAKSEGTPKLKHKVKPSVNVESEQLKAIVRQGRKMRKGKAEQDVTVQIFTPKNPPPPPMENHLQTNSKHHLIQHSEYKYEKIPPPFYLHPPPAPYPSPQNSPEHFLDQEGRKIEDDLDSGIAVSLQGGTKLRHQQLLEKKSVFDIAYSEAAPSHLRSDSSTPPS